MVQTSQACHQRNRPGLHVRCVFLRRNSQAQKDSAEKMLQDSHVFNLSSRDVVQLAPCKPS